MPARYRALAYWVSIALWALTDSESAWGHHGGDGSGDLWSFTSRGQESEVPWTLLFASVLFLVLFGMFGALIRQVQLYRGDRSEGKVQEYRRKRGGFYRK